MCFQIRTHNTCLNISLYRDYNLKENNTTEQKWAAECKPSADDTNKQMLGRHRTVFLGELAAL